jgi:hypothetical protein
MGTLFLASYWLTKCAVCPGKNDTSKSLAPLQSNCLMKFVNVSLHCCKSTSRILFALGALDQGKTLGAKAASFISPQQPSIGCAVFSAPHDAKAVLDNVFAGIDCDLPRRRSRLRVSGLRCACARPLNRCKLSDF